MRAGLQYQHEPVPSCQSLLLPALPLLAAPAHGQAAAIHKPTYAHAVAAKPYREALKLRLDLNLEVEIDIKAKVNGDITLSLL